MMAVRRIDILCRMAASTLVICMALVFSPCQTTNAISLNPLDYFSYTYSITFNQTYINEGEVFYAELEGQAACIEDAPIHPTEAYLRGRVVGHHIASGTRISLNSGYETTISPVPSRKGEIITAMQEIALYFPWGSPDGEYHITAELIEAKFKAGGLWFDATSAFPQQQDMGDAFYNVTEPSTTNPPITSTTPVQPTTTSPVIPTTTEPPHTTTTPTTTPPTTITTEPTTTRPDPGGPSIPPGATDITGLIDETGYVRAPVLVSSADGFSCISVESGNVATMQNGKVPSWLMLSRTTTESQMTEDILMIGNAYEVLPEGAVFKLQAKISFSYYDAQLPAGMDENLLLIARWDNQAEEWIALENPVIDSNSNTISASFYESGIYTTLAPVSPPVFEIQNLRVFPTTVAPGEIVSIQCNATNTGTIAGYYELVFKLNGSTQEVKRISLAGGESREIHFAVIRSSPGTYAVEINGLAGTYQIAGSELPTVTTTASAPPPNLEEKDSSQTWIIYAVNGILLIIVGILVLNWRVKKR